MRRALLFDDLQRAPAGGELEARAAAVHLLSVDAPPLSDLFLVQAERRFETAAALDPRVEVEPGPTRHGDLDVSLVRLEPARIGEPGELDVPVPFVRGQL